MAFESDDNAFPLVELADLPAFGRIVFPELVGQPVGDAVVWAESVGWEEVQLVDLGADEETFYTLEGRPPATRVTLKHDDGVIVEAVAG